MRLRLLVLTLGLVTLAVAAGPPAVSDLKITVLSTMLADRGIGEWGFSALVESGGRWVLFDTGARPETVLSNSREMGIDLSGIEEVILTHNHLDHTGGLVTLRRELRKKNPKALSRAWVAKGIFYPRPADQDRPNIRKAKTEYEALGGTFRELDAPAEIFPGAWLTGPVPRKYPERNWSGAGKLRLPDGQIVEDTLPEDMSLVLDTPKGLVVLSGCGHSGIVNTMEYARSKVRAADVYAAIGGFHLFNLDEERLAWTAGKLKEFGLRQFVGAHCTGIESTIRLRELMGAERGQVGVGAVGSRFSLAEGLNLGAIAR